MARSKRKTPVRGITTAESEKDDKVASHRKARRVVKQAIEPGLEAPLPLERELTNSWSLAKDGKVRFNPGQHPHLLHK